MLLDGKTVLVTGVGVGLGKECATSALRDGANVVLGARRKDELAQAAADLDPGGEAHGSPGHRHHRCRLLCVARPTGAGTVRVGRRSHPGGRVRARLGRPVRPQARRLAGGVRYQRARCADAPTAGGQRHEGRRRRIGRLHRLPVDVQARHAPGRLRRLEERPVDGDLLPGRRARPGQHPVQHGHPLVDVGAQRRALCFRHGSTAGPDRTKRSSTTWSPTSPSDG